MQLPVITFEIKLWLRVVTHLMTELFGIKNIDGLTCFYSTGTVYTGWDNSKKNWVRGVKGSNLLRWNKWHLAAKSTYNNFPLDVNFPPACQDLPLSWIDSRTFLDPCWWYTYKTTHSVKKNISVRTSVSLTWDSLTCHSRKSTGVNDKMNGDWIPFIYFTFRVLVFSMLAASHSVMSFWNSWIEQSHNLC